MQVQFQPTENGKTLTIPDSIFREANMPTSGSYIMEIVNGTILLYPAHKHKSLEERAAEFGGVLEPAGEFDWGKPVGREVALYDN